MAHTLFDTWQHDYAGEFHYGVALLVAHCPGAVTAKIRERLQHLAATGQFPDGYMAGKLENALRDNPTPNPSPKGEGGLIAAPVEVGGVEWKRPEQAPLPFGGGAGGGVDLARPLHKLHSHHHALLVSATTDETRAEQARKIMEEIIPNLDAIYDAARNGDPHPPAPSSQAEKSGVDLIRRLQSLRTRVARIRNQLLPAVLNLARKAELEKELETKLAEITRIEKIV